MSKKAIFFHAGCPVCVDAEQQIALALDPAQYVVDIVHLGEDKARLEEAIEAGVKSVPALLLDGGIPLHINFGASIEELR
ncbi:thioredoxin family protein [Citrobacter amalonaticus]|uniref:Thioredoxin family protein n=1 Tax=Citrobacter amalonaticus TaxID=35703 RepID=A0A2S4S2J2_CITAM|nr:thioredoxin family protein [Citrobacter amalonaticus]POT59477.1 thioredoxin family protein [Citrobacter amalonaticus]POT77607.1 thioredoxin family protein [Citrobacter amalonaticus]POU68059.1 thioredoxin family protein [Citrobacter amalonaticus]POV07663.1 thioredoxin family protein [Citrobacter amalonaticus]